MKIDGVPGFLKDSVFHRAWEVVLQNSPSRIIQEESVEGCSKIDLFIQRFRRWVEMALKESHDGTLPHNFSIVDDLERVFRGGCPKPEHIERFQQLGITKVISLHDPEFEREMKSLDPLSKALEDKDYIDHQKIILSRSTVKENKELVEIAKKIYKSEIYKNEEEGNLYIHCENGAKRTGRIIAALRILKQVDVSCIDTERKLMKSYGDIKFETFPMGKFLIDYSELWNLCTIARFEIEGQTKLAEDWKEMMDSQ